MLPCEDAQRNKLLSAVSDGGQDSDPVIGGNDRIGILSHGKSQCSKGERRSVSSMPVKIYRERIV